MTGTCMRCLTHGEVAEASTVDPPLEGMTEGILGILAAIAKMLVCVDQPKCRERVAARMREQGRRFAEREARGREKKLLDGLRAVRDAIRTPEGLALAREILSECGIGCECPNVENVGHLIGCRRRAL